MQRMIGLPVILGQKKVGLISDVRLTPNGQELSGLMVRSGLSGPKWVAREHIRILGGVSVLADAPVGRVPGGVGCRLGQVCDTSGLKLGSVTDVWIDPESFRVLAIEVSNGPLDDLLEGRVWIRRFSVQPENGRVLVPCGEKKLQ